MGAVGSWCCRLSGLLVQPVVSRWPVWKCADRVQIDTAGSKPSFSHWFSRSRLIDRFALTRSYVLARMSRRLIPFARLLSPPAQVAVGAR